jgi:organic radical activating enzyme
VLNGIGTPSDEGDGRLKARGVVQAWGRILAGRTPSLAIEVTRECPLSCPGCYFHDANHIGMGHPAAELHDCKGPELVDGVMELVRRVRPLHVSLVGGEPLVRYRELSILLPMLGAMGVHTQVVTSAVRQIPTEWNQAGKVDIVVSIDGLQPEHDARRKPATYDRILEHIRGHSVIIHCTVTRQMTERPAYLKDFVELWSGRQEARKIWVSLYTPQNGERSDQVLSTNDRAAVIAELRVLRREFPKLDLPEGLINCYLSPPRSPAECIFAKTTTAIGSDLATEIAPCMLGGNPNCSECGCMGSAGLQAVGRHRLPVIGLRVGRIYDVSYAVGRLAALLRHGVGAVFPSNGKRCH